MGDVVSSIFGGAKAKAVGPSAAQLAAQKKQDEAITKKEKTEKRERTARRRVIASRQGRRGLGTLFAETGELGVSLGGAGK